MSHVMTFTTDGGDSGLGPATHFVVENGGTNVASGELFSKSPIASHVGQLLLVRWEADEEDAARAIIEVALATAEPGSEIHLQANVEVHAHIEQRLALAAECGFELWQEKEGFWWADGGQDLPRPERITVRTLDDIGREAYVALMAETALDSLDRLQADCVDALGATRWADEFLTEYGGPDYDMHWLVATNARGAAVGYVAVGAMDEDDTGTIFHIGVAAAHRGNGYIDELLRVVNRDARDRGYTGLLNEVDVANAPMMAAMQRNGHRPDVRPWHKWYFRRTV